MCLYLEMWLVEDVRELGSCVTAMCDWAQIPQDVLQQLHVFVPHRLETRFLRTLCILHNTPTFLQHAQTLHGIMSKCVCVLRVSYHWTFHDAFEEDEVEVISGGRAGAVTQSIHLRQSYTERRNRGK